MKYRKLRIAWSVAWGVMAVLLLVLWVRSYWWIDSVYSARSTVHISITVFRGQVGATWLKYPAPIPVQAQSFMRHSNRITGGTRVNYNDGTGKPLPSYLGFKSSWLSAPRPLRAVTLVIPFWFPTFVLTLVAAAPYSRRMKWRFSLRTLLIATTLIAVVLGAVVHAMR
jgi:hypothetical protein